jgi:hypothetical protein
VRIKHIPRVLLSLTLILLATGCGSRSSFFSEKHVPLVFSLNENGLAPYTCENTTEQGLVCTLSIQVENTGNSSYTPDATARAIDEKGRTFAPIEDWQTGGQFVAHATGVINPGEKLDWALEFPVSSGAHLVAVEILEGGNKVSTIKVDLTAN